MRLLTVFVSTALALSVSVSGPGTAIAAPRSGGTLVIGSTATPRHLNPAVQSGAATAVPGTQIFAAPLRYDENWQPHPYLAESWKIADDGLSVTLKLRQNARFHDGQPITSEDVAFSVKTVRENHPFKTMFAPVTRVDTPDPHTAIIRLANPHPAILLAMSSALLPIIPKHVYGDGQDPKTHPKNLAPVGSGPFKFVEYKKGRHIILERNPDYFLDGRPAINKIIIKIFKDANSLDISQERGDVHMQVFNTRTRALRRLQKAENLMVTSQGYAAVGPIAWLAFNHQHDILRHQHVRQAIAYAIDRNFIVKALHGGLSQPAYGPIIDESPFATTELERYDLDLDKANQLLDEAGYPRGPQGMRFKLTLDFLRSITDIAEYLKPQLKKIGIDISLRTPPDFPTWARWISNHEFDLTLDVVWNWGDPVIGVHRTYISSNIRKGVIWSNTQSYVNPEVDAILERAARENDLARRKALYKEFQQLVANELPVYWLIKRPYHTVYDKNIGNPPRSIWGPMAPMDEIYLKN
ncbi:Oligopeptide-binding protein AppA [Candidatus Entotheonellaceae bacterium PAL068K]